MRTDMLTDVCIDMGNMGMGMYVDMCVDMPIGMGTEMCNTHLVS